MRQRWHRRAKSVNGFMWGRVGVESRPRARKRHGTSNEETFISKGPSEGSLSRELDKRELFRVAPIAQTPSEGASKATNRGKLARSAVPNTFLCARDEVTGKKSAIAPIDGCDASKRCREIAATHELQQDQRYCERMAKISNAMLHFCARLEKSREFPDSRRTRVDSTGQSLSVAANQHDCRALHLCVGVTFLRARGEVPGISSRRQPRHADP